MPKRARLREGDTIQLGDGRNVVIEKIDGPKVDVSIEAPEHVTIKNRYMTREATTAHPPLLPVRREPLARD